MNELVKILEMLDDVLDAVRDHDGDLRELRREYNAIVNGAQRKLWREIKKTLEGELDAAWLDDLGDAVDLVLLILRRFGPRET